MSQPLENPAVADILICFGKVSDWSRMSLPIRKEDKGTLVYDILTNAAVTDQQGVKLFLQERNIAFTSFAIVNAVHTTVPVRYLPEIAQMEGVDKIIPNTPFIVDPIEVSETDLQMRSVLPEWGILHIRADSVWRLGFNGQGVVVGGADTGFDWLHPALMPKYRGTQESETVHAYNWHDAIHEIDPANNDSIILPSNNPCGLDSPFPCDDNGHGTHTMGTMTGEEGEDNMIGVAPGAKWIACRNMERGKGTPATYLECMEWFLAPTDAFGENPDPLKSPHVINNSWTCPESEGCNLSNFELLRQAVVNLRAAGIVVVASAGNSGSECATITAPLAIFEETFSVGAINMADTIAGFSSRGPVEVDSSMRVKPNVCAPGVQVRSSWIGNTYRNANGTSMSGPHVAGTVALMISANPNLAGQVELIENILESTARPKTTLQECGGMTGAESPNNTFGYGVIDALRAVEAALLISSTEPEGEIQKEGLFTFFPNPVNASLYIYNHDRSEATFLRLFTPDGRLVFSLQNTSLPAQLDMHELPQGLYYLQVEHFAPVLIHVIH